MRRLALVLIIACAAPAAAQDTTCKAGEDRAARLAAASPDERARLERCYAYLDVYLDATYEADLAAASRAIAAAAAMPPPASRPGAATASPGVLFLPVLVTPTYEERLHQQQEIMLLQTIQLQTSPQPVVLPTTPPPGWWTR